MKYKHYIIAIFLLITVLIVLTDTNIGSFVGITGQAVSSIPQETTQEPIVMFCPQDLCAKNLIKLLENADTVHCAFFEPKHHGIIEALKQANAQVVADNDYESEILAGLNVKYDNDNQLSHNKFCIFNNNIVWTGSFNPTSRADEANNENAIVFHSENLAKNYEAEFQELWAGEFGKGAAVEYPKILLNTKLVENYFCPEDHCAERVIDILDTANSSIYFMTFSFTHDRIGDALVSADVRGADVQGVFEARQKSKHGEYDKLKNAGIQVWYDKNKATMHHKVFIIDENIVVTGSFNPTGNGDKNNDENLIIVHDENIAMQFLKEFEKIKKEALGTY